MPLELLVSEETKRNASKSRSLQEGHVGVRDSKNPTGAALVFAPAEWDAFAVGVDDDEFNRS